MAKLAIELHGEAYARPTSRTLGDDFHDIRSVEFPCDKRQLADFRRSGAVEAIGADATAEQLAHAMGNTLSASNALFATYVPVYCASLRAIMHARRLGRRRSRENG